MSSKSPRPQAARTAAMASARGSARTSRPSTAARPQGTSTPPSATGLEDLTRSKTTLQPNRAAAAASSTREMTPSDAPAPRGPRTESAVAVVAACIGTAAAAVAVTAAAGGGARDIAGVGRGVVVLRGASLPDCFSSFGLVPGSGQPDSGKRVSRLLCSWLHASLLAPRLLHLRLRPLRARPPEPACSATRSSDIRVFFSGTGAARSLKW